MMEFMILGLMMLCGRSNSTSGTTSNSMSFGAGAANEASGYAITWPISMYPVHECTQDCVVNCVSDDSCTYRRFQCGSAGNPVSCDVYCEWDGTGQPMHWMDVSQLDTSRPGEWGGTFQMGITYPACNQAQFIVAPGSHLKLHGVGQGVLAQSKITAAQGSTVDLDVNGDWGLLWADINAADAQQLDIEVTGEGVLWDANIDCPATPPGAEPLCRVNLVTDDDASDYRLTESKWTNDPVITDDYGLLFFNQLVQGTSPGDYGSYDFYYFSDKFGEGFKTALMTGTQISASSLDDVEVNCKGDVFDGVYFSDVDDTDKNGRSNRSRTPQIVTTGSGTAGCLLNFNLIDATEWETELHCGQQIVRGSCHRPPYNPKLDAKMKVYLDEDTNAELHSLSDARLLEIMQLLADSLYGCANAECSVIMKKCGLIGGAELCSPNQWARTMLRTHGIV